MCLDASTPSLFRSNAFQSAPNHHLSLRRQRHRRRSNQHLPVHLERILRRTGRLRLNLGSASEIVLKGLRPSNQFHKGVLPSTSSRSSRTERYGLLSEHTVACFCRTSVVAEVERSCWTKTRRRLSRGSSFPQETFRHGQQVVCVFIISTRLSCTPPLPEVSDLGDARGSCAREFSRRRRETDIQWHCVALLTFFYLESASSELVFVQSL